MYILEEMLRERDLKIMKFLFSLWNFHFVKQKYIYNGEQRDDILKYTLEERTCLAF